MGIKFFFLANYTSRDIVCDCGFKGITLTRTNYTIAIHQVDVYQSDLSLPPIKAIVYIGTPDNPQFVVRNGVPGVQDLATHIYRSQGPSGDNKEYLYKLHHALEELCLESRDNHIGDLFRLVAILEAEDRLRQPEQDILVLSMQDETQKKINANEQEEAEPKILGPH